MVIDFRVVAVTVSVIAFEVTPLWVAVILLMSRAVPLASPLVLMLTAAAFEEDQVTELVKSWALPSLKVPVAVN